MFRVVETLSRETFNGDTTRVRIKDALRDNLGINSNAEVIRLASNRLCGTRGKLAHNAGSGTFGAYRKHHVNIKIGVLDAIIHVWLLRFAGVDRDDALQMLKLWSPATWPTSWSCVRGLELHDQTSDEMPDTVWWTQ